MRGLLKYFTGITYYIGFNKTTWVSELPSPITTKLVGRKLIDDNTL